MAVSTTVLTIQPHRGRGGPAIQHLSFIRHLRQEGFFCHAVIPVAHELLADYRDASDQVTELPHLSTVPRTASPLAMLRFAVTTAREAVWVSKAARGSGASVIHTFNEACPSGYLGARLALTPSVVHVIGMSIFQPRQLARLWAGVLNATNDAVVCCQQEIRERFTELGVDPSKLHVVYNSIDPEAIRAEAAATASPAREEGTIRVGTVAGLDPRKGHVLLIEAARLVAARIPEARFFIVGRLDGNPGYLQQVRSAISAAGLDRHITLVGPVPSTAAWLASFDVYCVPSLSEALSVASLEAMALGIPVVATSVGGNKEAVVHGINGFLARESDPEDLAEQLATVLVDSEIRRRMGLAARSHVERLFTAGRNSAALGRVLRAYDG
jgi:glycosyltransferase involved in cell wall biosynthesis